MRSSAEGSGQGAFAFTLMKALPIQQQLTHDAKEALRKVIRRLREALITQLTDEVRGVYRSASIGHYDQGIPSRRSSCSRSAPG